MNQPVKTPYTGTYSGLSRSLLEPEEIKVACQHPFFCHRVKRDFPLKRMLKGWKMSFTKGREPECVLSECGKR